MLNARACRSDLAKLLLDERKAISDSLDVIIEKKEKIRTEMDQMSCSNFKEFLPQLEEGADLLRETIKGTANQEVAIYTIKRALRKSVACI